MAEQMCPNRNCQHPRRWHNRYGCGEMDLEGKTCSCKRKYNDGGWV